ncbi:MAG: ribonuclease HII [Candidatus Nanoarchaeia archaeon]
MATYLLGIDDAGRGPVIGPMVLAGILIPKEQEEQLKQLGVKDSKLLQPIKRRAIAEHLKSYQHAIELAFPDEIDARGFAGTNLNKIEAVKAAKIINKLIENYQDIEVIIDCPSRNIPAWHAYLLKYIKQADKIILKCEHEADFNHPVVSAASIIAKETREQAIAKIKQEHNIEFGSGYCHDPLTSKFLKGDISHLQDKGLIRKSWYTYTKLIAEKEQKELEF